jgi:hypothetical protein
LQAGDLWVYINDPSGYFTSDQLARIQDTIAGLDTLLAPYNVTVAEVSDISQANIIMDIGNTSAAGSGAQGVLGCYDPVATEITFILGWNWYAGADPSQIGPDQYDFQTTVAHEFGHALGLGGSYSSTSPMNETLPMGVTRRTMTVADLNIPYDEEGADALTAAGFVLAAARAHTSTQVVDAGSTPVRGGLNHLTPEISTGFAGALLVNLNQGNGAFSTLVTPGSNYQMVGLPNVAEKLPDRGRGLSLRPAAGLGAEGIPPAENSDEDFAAGGYDFSSPWSPSDPFVNGLLNATIRNMHKDTSFEVVARDSIPGREQLRSALPVGNGNEWILHQQPNARTETDSWQQGAADLATPEVKVHVLEESLVNLLAFALVGAAASYPGVISGKAQQDRKKGPREQFMQLFRL